MRILVYPHSTELGGSQLNAIELAAAVRDRGHEVVVYSTDGPLVDRLTDLGLEWLPRRPSRITPGPSTARDLRRIIEERSIDVVHGWEWPPILECYAATHGGTLAATVGSIMSMGVAPFLPAGISLTVGTEMLRRETARSRRGVVELLEPPVDTAANAPGWHGERFRREFPASPGTLHVVVVSRLARELKLEGLLTAIRAVSRLAEQHQVRLVIVGDGPARAEVEQAVADVRRASSTDVVLLVGALSDPRGAYDAADLCLGMGGSALRSMAFEKPLVVQGEGGFFETCREETLAQFLHGGWYGLASRSPDEAEEHLIKELDRLLSEPDYRAHLGAFGRDLVVRRYSLDAAAERLEQVYVESRQAHHSRFTQLSDSVVAAGGLAAYKIHRRWRRWRGQDVRDDFNARR